MGMIFYQKKSNIKLKRLMDYQELKEFAAQLNIERTETPLNALKLVKQLNIP